MNKNKIAIIITWYGKWPDYLHLFLKGLEHNKDIIDVILVTDNELNTLNLQNLKILNLSFDQLKLRIESVFNYTPSFNNPYKLCDFKPMYGKLFQKEIVDYEFWGYGDLDIIYGDLKKFLSYENLQLYDVFTFREYIISGALTILRNNEYTINLFRKSPDLKKVLQENSYVAFDEAGKKIAQCRKRIRAYKLIHIDNFVCWSSIIHEEFDKRNLNLYTKYELIEAIRPGLIYNYSNGLITLGSHDEFIAYHFVTEKNSTSFKFPNWTKIPDDLILHNTGIYKKIGFYFYFTRFIRVLMGNMSSIKTRINDSFKFRILKK